MKITVQLNNFRDGFRNSDRINNFSYSGLTSLFDYLTEYENDTGSELELDAIAICCDFAEDSAEDIADNYRIDIEGLDKDEIKKAILKYLEDEGALIVEVCEGQFLYHKH